MRYMFLIYDDENKWDATPDADKAAVFGEHMAYSEALKKAGAYVAGAPLGHSRAGRRIIGERIDNGPFADSKEQLGGFYMIEADNLDDALEWAARCPAASYGKVEVRPVWNIEE